MLLTVIDKIHSIGMLVSMKGRKDPFHAQEVVDAVNQNGVNTILFDVVFLPPNVVAPNATPATPAVEPNTVATNLPI